MCFLIVFNFPNVCDIACFNSEPAMSEQVEQTQSERRYWKKPVELKRTNNLRLLSLVWISVANMQNLDEALDAPIANIEPTLKRICNKMKGIKIWSSIHVQYKSSNPLKIISQVG